MMKKDAYLGWMTVDGGGRRKSGKVCESIRVFGDIALDVEASGNYPVFDTRYPTPQHLVQHHQTL